MTMPPDGSAQAPPRDRKAAWIDDLAVRAASGVVLALAALAAAWIGGAPFVLMWTAAAMAIFWEWARLVSPGNRLALAAGLCALAVVGVFTVCAMYGLAAAVAAVGAVVVGLCVSPQRRLWAATGVLYAGIAVVAPSLLRADFEYGLTATFLLFAIVWMTDIGGYFVGRWVGGPKLWHRISPNKTWSGALGSLAGAMAAGLAVGWLARLPSLVATAPLALVLSVAAQGGDLVESAIKRRFGVKDVSHLIPGHGGLMDRLDGFLAAALIAAVLGVARGGVDGAARGFLIW